MCKTSGGLVDRRDERFSRARIRTTQDGKNCRRRRKLVEKELGWMKMKTCRRPTLTFDSVPMVIQ